MTTLSPSSSDATLSAAGHGKEADGEDNVDCQSDAVQMNGFHNQMDMNTEYDVCGGGECGASDGSKNVVLQSSQGNFLYNHQVKGESGSKGVSRAHWQGRATLFIGKIDS